MSYKIIRTENVVFLNKYNGNKNKSNKSSNFHQNQLFILGTPIHIYSFDKGENWPTCKPHYFTLPSDQQLTEVTRNADMSREGPGASYDCEGMLCYSQETDITVSKYEEKVRRNWVNKQ